MAALTGRCVLSLSQVSGGSSSICHGCSGRKALDVKALVVFDYAQPALWLGTALIGGGISLYNLRNVQPMVAKDSDVALSCILVFSGGILIFQGWRLDPLLLFVQICLAGTAFTWALEAIKLRKDVDQGDFYSNRRRPEPQLEDRRRRDYVVEDRNQLPAGSRGADFGQWYGNEEREDEFQDALPASRGFYSGRGQPSYAATPSGRTSTYDPAEYTGYQDQYMPDVDYSEDKYPQPSRGGDEYGSFGQQSEQYYEDDYEQWNGQSYQNRGYQEGYRDSAVEAPYGDQQVFDTYSRVENDFLPENGSPVEVEEPAVSNSRVVDEVENFYKRPESVVEDVQRFYDARGQLITPSAQVWEEEDVEEPTNPEEEDPNNGYRHGRPSPQGEGYRSSNPDSTAQQNRWSSYDGRTV